MHTESFCIETIDPDTKRRVLSKTPGTLMALVDWALTCDFAYFEATGRLCVIGADANGLRTVASGTHRLTLVAHLVEYRDDPLDPVLALRSPEGEWRLAQEGTDYTRERQGSAVLFHLSRIQLIELGTYRFEL